MIFTQFLNSKHQIWTYLSHAFLKFWISKLLELIKKSFDWEALACLLTKGIHQMIAHLTMPKTLKLTQLQNDLCHIDWKSNLIFPWFRELKSLKRSLSTFQSLTRAGNQFVQDLKLNLFCQIDLLLLVSLPLSPQYLIAFRGFTIFMTFLRVVYGNIFKSTQSMFPNLNHLKLTSNFIIIGE